MKEKGCKTLDESLHWSLRALRAVLFGKIPVLLECYRVDAGLRDAVSRPEGPLGVATTARLVKEISARVADLSAQVFAARMREQMLDSGDDTCVDKVELTSC